MSERTVIERHATVTAHPGTVSVLGSDVLAALPTPAYVYDLAEIRDSAAALRDALPADSTLYYSLKANPHPAILRTVRAAGLHAEVCSRGEVDSALAAGFAPAELLLNGPGKRDTDIDHALGLGLTLFSVDSPFAIEQLSRRAARAGARVRCLLRVNDEQAASGQGLAMTGVPSPFGADARWILAEPHRFAGTGRVRVVGLHLYMGTNLTSVPDLADQFARSLSTARKVGAALNGAGADIATLDLGGGFGAPFARAGSRIQLAGLRGQLDLLLAGDAADRPVQRPSVAFESGRYIASTAGTLLSRVLDVKISHGQRMVILDTGINHLGGMSGLRRLRPLAPQIVAVSPARPGGMTRAMICGPLCTPLDSWARDAELPALAPGDMIAVPNVGAYGLSASLVAFLGHPMPLEVVVDTADPGPPVLEISQLELVRHHEPGGSLPGPPGPVIPDKENPHGPSFR